MWRYLAVFAGIIAIGVSATLFVTLVVRPNVSLNWFNGYTLAVTSAAGLLAIAYYDRLWAQAGSLVLLIVGAYPSTFAWIGFLYVPSVFMLLAAILLELGHRILVKAAR